jgi:hypothetical protein
VLRQVLRRAVDLLFVFFAVLGFCSVPLGQKTAYEHCRALSATDAAAELARGLAGAVDRARRWLDPAREGDDPANSAQAPLANEPMKDAGADVSVVWPGPT